MDSGRAEGSEGGGLGFSDFAVLFRTAAQADTLEAAFARSGMPCQRRSHAPLAEAPAVLALLESMQRSDPEAAVTAQLAEAAAHIAGDRRPEAEAAAAALAPMAARARTREEFRTEIALASESDLWDPRAEAVSLLTLHASKGLEFPVVFVVGCEEGILPLGWGATDRSDLDEERRLLFVGMTRARQRLFLCHAARRHWRGALRSMRRSPFLDVIEEQLVERSETRTRSRPPAPAATQLNLF
jgi:DNA helicase-2/ATP-dependent DNA helicase PcrA